MRTESRSTPEVGPEVAVGLHRDPPPQAVAHQGLMGLGQADLPGGAGVVDGGDGAGAGGGRRLGGESL